MGLSPRGSKNKGDAYERELAHYMNDRLFGGREQIYRAPLSGGGRQFVSGGGSADLIGTPEVWVEAKRTEKFQPYAAMEQAETGIRGKRTKDKPVVISRRSRVATGDSLVVMRLDDWLDLYAALLSQVGIRIEEKNHGIETVKQVEDSLQQAAENTGA